MGDASHTAGFQQSGRHELPHRFLKDPEKQNKSLYQRK